MRGPEDQRDFWSKLWQDFPSRIGPIFDGVAVASVLGVLVQALFFPGATGPQSTPSTGTSSIPDWLNLLIALVATALGAVAGLRLSGDVIRSTARAWQRRVGREVRHSEPALFAAAAEHFAVQVNADEVGGK